MKTVDSVLHYGEVPLISPKSFSLDILYLHSHI